MKVTRKNKRCFLIYLFLLQIICCSVTGCGNPVGQADAFYAEADKKVEEDESIDSSYVDKMYDQAMDRYMNPEAVEDLDGTDVFDKLLRMILKGYRRVYNVIKALLPAICTICLTVCIAIYVLSRRNKEMKKGGIVIAAGIMFAAIVFVYGLPIFNGIFLY